MNGPRMELPFRPRLSPPTRIEVALYARGVKGLGYWWGFQDGGCGRGRRLRM